VTEMIEGDPNVRFVYKEPPTLADASHVARSLTDGVHAAAVRPLERPTPL
jgi:hypothetical protein